MKNIIIIIFLLFGKQNLFSQNNKVSVSIETRQLSINNRLVFKDDGFYFKIDSFSKVFKEKPKRHKNATTGLYDFWYEKQGTCVSQSEKRSTKASYPMEIVFNFNYVFESVPFHTSSLFKGDFYIHGVKIDANTTESDLQFLKQYYPASEVTRMRFDRFHIEFENKLKNPKITSITYKL